MKQDDPTTETESSPTALLLSAKRRLEPILRSGKGDIIELAVVLAHLRTVLENHERRLAAIERGGADWT